MAPYLRFVGVGSGAILAFIASHGCSKSEETPPGGEGGALVSSQCSSDADCDDGDFCTDDSCDALGCSYSPRCAPSQRCDGIEQVCLTNCDLEPDADGDGHHSVQCGGDDCDDSNSGAFPGNEERCDSAGIDEDCDPNTLAGPSDGDDDRDGFISDLCCNRQGEEFVCGDDCNDERATAWPGATEICNAADDNCDGRVDEGVTTRYYLDADGDGFGSAKKRDRVDVCEKPVGYREDNTDCDDSNNAINPGAYDRCDSKGIDDDCSGTADDPPSGCDCLGSDSRACPMLGACASSTQQCIDGAWGDCTTQPVEEICDNDIDDDCDGETDEFCPCEAPVRYCGTDEGVCERGIQICQADGSWGPCSGGVAPVVEVLCDGRDEDCDGQVDEDTGTLCYVDNDRDGFAPAGASFRSICGGSCADGETMQIPSPGNTDCDDADARAKPGQTQYFDTPRLGVGGYDFNCDGGHQGEPYPHVPISCPTEGSYMGCVNDGLTGLVSVPGCGQLGEEGYCREEDLGSTGLECIKEGAATYPYPRRKCR